MKLHLFTAALFVFSLSSAVYAGEDFGDIPGCTTWERSYGVNCIDADKVRYTRDCSEAAPALRCTWHPNPIYRDGACLQEGALCFFRGENPNDYVTLNPDPEASCTDWRIVRGANCGSRTKKWERTCTLARVATIACTPSNKRYPDKGDYIE